MAMDNLRRFAERLLPQSRGPEPLWRDPVMLDRGPLGSGLLRAAPQTLPQCGLGTLDPGSGSGRCLGVGRDPVI